MKEKREERAPRLEFVPAPEGAVALLSGIFKSLFEEESFGSYTGECLLMRLLNTPLHIVWWHRPHPRGGA